MISRVIEETVVQEFRSRFAGPIFSPVDEGYDAARLVWNGMIDRHPCLVARCSGVADVIAAVNFGRSQGLPVAVRGGGHNVAGFSTCDGGLVIDLLPMKGIRVDPSGRRARVEGGVIWREFDREAQAFELATTGGLVSETGIAGLTLGGGIGWLMAKYGLTCDNLLSADVVTADGRFLTASATENPDLFWALRGGGGNFGVVTSFEYALHPVGPMVIGGAVFYPAAMAADVLRFYRDWRPTLSDDISTLVALFNCPPERFIPAELHFKPVIAVALCHCGPDEQALREVQALKEFGPPAVDAVGPIPYVVLQRMFDASAPRGIHSYWKTEYLSAILDGAIDALVEGAYRSPSPLFQVHLHSLGGAIGRVAADATAFGRRDMPYMLNIVGLWRDAPQTSANIAWVRALWQSIQPHAAGGVYLNFMDNDEAARVPAAYGDNYAHLAAVKAKYDPQNFFRLNQNISPKLVE